eukprot:jgi/Astpho2/932/Aster-00769
MWSFWQLVQQLEESHSVLSVMKTPERIKTGVRMRLEMNIPYIEAPCSEQQQVACCLQSSGRKPCTSKHSPKMLPQHSVS